MSPEILVAIIAAVAVIAAAVVAALPPLLLAMRRTRGAVAAEGTATREALDALGAVLNARVDDVRDDLDEVREGVSRVREWQAGHDAEHLIIVHPHYRGDSG